MKVVAEQQQQIRTLEKVVSTLCSLAGIRIVADDANPAQPVAQPAGGGAVPFSVAPLTTEDVANVGGTPGASNVAPDATANVDSIGGEDANGSTTQQTVVTEPVPYAAGAMPYNDVVTRPVIEFGDPLDPEVAFPLQGDFASPAGFSSGPVAPTEPNDVSTVARRRRQATRTRQAARGRQAASRAPRPAPQPSDGRTFAAIRLARLQIAAGLVKGDDLSLGQKIAKDRSLSDEYIQTQIETLSALQQVERQPVRGQRRSLVPQAPRTASRSVPSMSSTPSQGLAPVFASIEDDELTFDFGPSAAE